METFPDPTDPLGWRADFAMEKSIRKDDMLHALIDAKADWVLAPNAFPSGSPKASAARHHGDVDSD